MADDIDIEEHDVLDNPKLRIIFPDLSVIKKEIFDNFEGDVIKEVTKIQEHQADFINSASIKCEDVSGSSIAGNIDSTTKDTNVVQKCYSQTQTNIDITESDIIQHIKIVPQDLNRSLNSKVKSNRIILGSKPQAKVMLEDVHSYLIRSKRFCSICLILFPDIKHLHKHELSHEVLGKTNEKGSFICWKCNKSYFYEAELKMHNSFFHKDTTFETKVIRKSISRKVNNHVCDKCGVKYIQKKNLVQHIRNKHSEIHITKNKQNDEVNRLASAYTFQKPLIMDVQSEIQKETPSKDKLKLKAKENYGKLKTSIVNRKDSKKCEICGIKCATKFNLQRHMKSHIDLTTQNEIKRNDKLKSINCKEDEDIFNKCFHCRKVFDDQKAYVEHLYNILQDKKYSSIEDKNEEDNICGDNDVMKSKQEFIRCPNCFYYFKYMQVYVAHMVKKHKIQKIPVVKLVAYKDSCYYCGQKSENWRQYNIHMQKVHSDKMFEHDENAIDDNFPNCNIKELLVCKVCFKTFDNPTLLNHHYLMKHKMSSEKPPQELNIFMSSFDNSADYNNSPIYSSILFKCNKCDVHFMFAKYATNHVQHMDMLINWKCPICLRIFKKQDEYLHTIQHSFTRNDFIVHELCDAELNHILFNCPKCAVHFNEDSFLNHYSKCEVESRKSIYCRDCDILINSDSINIHKTSHKESESKLNDFIFVETELQSKNNTGIKEGNQDNDTVFENTNSKKNTNEWFYCDCCKCYIRGKFKVACHLEKKCDHLTKYICKHCGLLLTSKTHQESHRKEHSNGKKFVIQDALFYDLRSGKQIVPPLPDFPKCNGCGVKFVRKYLIRESHSCANEKFVTCRICHDKFTNEAYNLHVAFHNYSLNKNKNDTSSKTLLGTISENENLIQEVSKMKLIVKVPKLNLSEVSVTDDFYPIYKCSLCRIAFDCYDKVIEHCQSHFTKEFYNYCPTKYCEMCDLEYYAQGIEEHINKHQSKEIDNGKIKQLEFDLDFFLQDNRTWLKHVFFEFPGRERSRFVIDSIYRHEARVKLTIIQDGPANLTLYKCDKCSCFVDRGSLFKHAKNSCFNIRKHDCSTCGLSFNSFGSKEDHERIHSNKQIEISENSYRIVVFNRAEDKICNDAISERKKYVLHQCRNCTAIVNIQKYTNHVCKPDDVTKCYECGLTFCNDDYKLHTLKHQECSDYFPRNMKVLLCGSKIQKEPLKIDSNSNLAFKGVIHDYTFYQCPDCQACMKDCHATRHDCDIKYMCKDCELFFVNKQHCKLHENDPEFVKNHINLIPLKTKPKIYETVCAEEENNRSLVRKSESEVDLSEGIPLSKIKQIIIYKCICGLHFFEPPHTITHLQRNCNPKVKYTGQKCAKCDLVFTPKILFNHVLKHHANKTISFKYKIVELYKKHLILYKCSKCVLHFSTYGDTFDHIQNCEGHLINGKQCKVCERQVASSQLKEHEEDHTSNRELLIRDVFVTDASNDSDATSNADSVMSGFINLSKQQLSIMDLSKYSNVLYKCQTCGFLALDQITLVCHLLANVHNVKNLESCTRCGYHFPLSSLMTHIYVHHDKWNLSKNSFVIEEYKDV